MASDSKQADKKSLEKQRDNVKSQMNSCQDKIEEYDDQIRRLEKVKDTVEDLKKTYEEDVTKSDKATKSRRREWTGSNYNKFAKKMDTLVTDNKDYYDYTLDYVLDEVNRKIADLKKARNGAGTLWAKLKNAWIDLCTAVENCIN